MGEHAPDWYQDPTGRHLRRWHDGEIWTDRVQRQDGTEALDPLDPPTVAPPSGSKRPVGLLLGAGAGLLVVVLIIAGIAGAGDDDGPGSRAEAVAAGNVALCGDGTYSDNHDFDATCSSHGEVDTWLAPYGRCEDGTVISIDESSSCEGNGGFSALLPIGFTPSAAPGDVARCVDGTYADNLDLADTCSSRGGVDEWLATYGECGDGTVVEVADRPSCLGHGGFRRLKPREWTPPTTTAPPPTTRQPTTTTTTTTPPPTPPPTTAPPPTAPPTTAPPTAPPAQTAPPAGDCHPSYTPCVPNVPGDLDCPDVGFPVQVHGPDPYGLDGNDNDGLGCESY